MIGFASISTVGASLSSAVTAAPGSVFRRTAWVRRREHLSAAPLTLNAPYPSEAWIDNERTLVHGAAAASDAANEPSAGASEQDAARRRLDGLFR